MSVSLDFLKLFRYLCLSNLTFKLNDIQSPVAFTLGLLFLLVNHAVSRAVKGNSLETEVCSYTSKHLIDFPGASHSVVDCCLESL